MRVIALKKNGTIYTCNSYLILGDWNRIEDVNTLIDPGTDDFVMDEIEAMSTGFGKVPVQQVILTHNHFDHCGGVAEVKRRYGARVFAFTDGPQVDELVYDGQFIPAGDDFLEVLHAPGHSSDSICLYQHKEKILFSGDMQLRVLSPGGVYTPEYIASLEKIHQRKIRTIYSGHDAPVAKGASEMIRSTMSMVLGKAEDRM